jgi:hypothetical protein
MLKIGDYIIILLIITAIVFIFRNEMNKTFSNAEVIKAEVLVDGILTQEIYLNDIKDGYVFSPTDAEAVVVEVEKNRIRIQQAVCRDKICIANGWLSKPGDTAVCLPTRTMVKIVGTVGVDSVAY